MRTQKHGNNECSGTGCHMVQRHYHWFLPVMQNISGLVYVRRCWRNSLKHQYLLLFFKQSSVPHNQFLAIPSKTPSKWVESCDSLNMRAAKFHKNLQILSLCAVPHSLRALTQHPLQWKLPPPCLAVPSVMNFHSPGLCSVHALVFASTHSFRTTIIQGLWD